MIVHYRIKTNILATLCGLILGSIYLFFYINGFFGKALFGWTFLSDLILVFIHPLSLLGLVPILILVYLKRNKNFNLGYQDFKKVIKGHIVVMVISTILLITLFLIQNELAFIYAFLYFFIIGFFSSYLLWMQIFQVKSEIES